MRQVEPGEVAEVAPAVFDAARRARAGQVDRSGAWWRRALGLDPYPAAKSAKGTWLVHEGPDGAPDGFVQWKATRTFDLAGPKGAVEVRDLVAATEDAYLDIWAYLAGLDAVDEVTAWSRPVDEPLRWVLADARALEPLDPVDDVWLRILDVGAALAARRYAVPGRLVLEVTDPHTGGPAAGRYALDATGDEVSCEATTAPADLEVPQRTLASVYLGGHRLLGFGRAGGVREHTAGAAGLADLMFSTPLPPWNQTGF